MPRELCNLMVGQCGNQVGSSFWQQLCLEHGIASDGTLQPFATEDAGDCKDVFFYQADDHKYVPRALLIDLEDRVVNKITKGSQANLFNPENIFVHREGSGAGNNWANGYVTTTFSESTVFYIKKRIIIKHSQNSFSIGHEISDTINEMISREVEGSDSFEGYVKFVFIIFQQKTKTKQKQHKTGLY